jgi:hypothetical protein
MAAWVLLRHELPDGSWHHDWMLEDPNDPHGRLITFRIDPGVSWPPDGAFAAARIGPHRREYLTFEGPVSDGRGSVRRVARGECEISVSGAGIAVTLGDRVMTGSPVGDAGSTRGEQVWNFQTALNDLEAGRD